MVFEVVDRENVRSFIVYFFKGSVWGRSLRKTPVGMDSSWEGKG